MKIYFKSALQTELLRGIVQIEFDLQSKIWSKLLFLSKFEGLRLKISPKRKPVINNR